MIVLPITITIAAAACLLNIWLAVRVGMMRRQHETLIGDGGHQPLIARMRAQANFVEYTPLFLILLGLIELAEGSMLWLWAVAILYMIARIAHMFGLERPTINALRGIGAGVSMLATLGLAVYALTIPYRHRAMDSDRITYVAADPAITLSATNGLVRRS